MARRETLEDPYDAQELSVENERWEEVVDKLKDDLEGPMSDIYFLRALGSLVFELKDKLPEYETIIGDDASGRLVALTLRNIIARERRERDMEPPETRFVAGGRGLTDKKKQSVFNYLDGVIEEQSEGDLGKTLLVTEYIGEGRGLSWLADFLEDRDVDYDIGSVSVRYTKSTYPESISNHIYAGEWSGSSGQRVHGKYRDSGVEKNQVDESDPHPEKFEFYKQQNVDESREDVKKISEKLYEIMKKEG